MGIKTVLSEWFLCLDSSSVHSGSAWGTSWDAFLTLWHIRSHRCYYSRLVPEEFDLTSAIRMFITSHRELLNSNLLSCFGWRWARDEKIQIHIRYTLCKFSLLTVHRPLTFITFRGSGWILLYLCCNSAN